ncbi:MAG: C4-type zinc ribbon domain-containing protein [Gemmatimonadota bacterium]
MAESETVETLLFLQEIDDSIGLNSAHVRSLDAELEGLGTRVTDVQDQEKGLAATLGRADEQLKLAERTVKAGRETLKRLHERAQQVQNMREHLAARAEVDAARNNLDMAEEEVLEAMQSFERAKIALQDQQQALADALEVLEERKVEIEIERTRLAEEIAVQTDQRKNRALRVDERVIDLYDSVRGGRTGNALAPVMDGVCGHCYMAIPKQRQAEIRRGGALIVCEACGVILHAPDSSP